MELFNSPNTCSMTEMGEIGELEIDTFDTLVKGCLSAAKDSSRKMIVTNIHDWAHEKYGKTLQANGFVFVGKYKGNSAPFVFTWIHGLIAPKPAPVARLKAIVRKVRKPLSR
jgi:hypothetical protein